LQPRGVEVLDRLGAVGDLVQRTRPIGQVVVNVGGRELARLAVGRPTQLVQRPGLIVSQVEVERALRRRLAALGGEVEWGRAVTDVRPVAGAVDVVLAGDEIVRAKWVIGCDGAHSTVRAAAGIEFPGVPRSERFLLADVRADLGLSRDNVTVWVSGRDLMAAFPLPGPAAWRLIATAPDAAVVAPDAVLDVLISRFRPHTGMVPVVHDCEWTSTFQIHRRLASSYRRDRVLLAGDAAHIHSPIGGQGMNTGIGDAENLAWKLAMVVGGRADDVLLDTYSAERRPVAEEVLASTGSFSELVLGGSLPARLVRDHALVPLFNAPFVQRLVSEQASQLKLTYRRGPLGDRSWGPRPRAGDRVTDIAGTREDGRATRLHAELGARWVIVAPASRRGDACTEAARRILGIEAMTRIMPAQRAYRSSVVRPDAHLAWSGRDPAALTRRLANVLWNAAG
jgi:4,5-epoxidase